MLSIFKASAGSGKTHNLSREYLKLLFGSARAYRHILAVTFTNKATEEMKHRIIEELYKLSCGKGNEEIINYLQSQFNFDNDPNISRAIIEARSREILIEILHDYSAFTISTIDKFFQQTLRAFAREIGKGGSYNIELDGGMILSKAIDQMILDLDKDENGPLLKWLLDFSIDRIEQGSSWNVREGLFSFAMQLFMEVFKLNRSRLREALQDRQSIEEFRQSLDAVIRERRAKIEQLGKRANEVVSSMDVSWSDFKGGSRTPFNYFNKMVAGSADSPTASFEKLINFDEWFSATYVKSRGGDVSYLHNPQLMSCVQEAIEMEEDRVILRSAIEARKNIYALGLIYDIDRYLNEYSKDNNLMLLSETTELLNRIIDGSDTPFIYEKIGTRFDHFMLDEFQDTSVMQWQNFKPLLINSMSQGMDNLIVGDVKQSIYRWRGSEWNLLNSGVYEDFSGYLYRDVVLDKNWRSLDAIIEFNNLFFPFVTKGLEDNPGSCAGIDIASIYSDVVQSTPPNNGDRPQGFVSLELIADEDSELQSEKALKRVVETINDVISRGYNLRDIAILVRKNSEASMVADYLIKDGIRVISDEALLISSSPAVMKLLAVLNVINTPHERIYAEAAKFEGVSGDVDLNLLRLPLYEMCEKIICDYIPNPNQSDSVFLQAFMDSLLEFISSNGADLAQFLEWWRERGVLRSISSPVSQDAVRIMTIHKSKGLGIDIVILPFVDFDFEPKIHGGSILWCSSDVEPFNKMPLIPLSYNKTLEGTCFKEEYLSEKLKRHIDVLNIAYVAFTRAKREMYIFSKSVEKQSKDRSDRDPKSIADYLRALPGISGFEDAPVCFGEPTQKADKKHVMANVEAGDREYEMEMPLYKSSAPDSNLKLSLKSEEYFNPESNLSYGLVMHEILSNINDVSDIPAAMEREVIDGVIGSDEAELLTKQISQYLSEVEDRGWFAPGLTVYNEMDIISPGGGVFRPDRIIINDSDSKGRAIEATVVDFKFGLNRPKSHMRQVERYVKLLKESGISQVKGYLWYVGTGEVIEVFA